MRFQVCTRVLRSMAAGLTLASALVLTPAASAQFGEAAGIAEAMQPDYFRRDVTIMNQGLRLDETQRIIVNTLFDDYQAAFEAGLERMKKRFEDMRDELQTGDQSRVMRVVFAPFREWSEEKAQLGQQFLANVEVILTADQRDIWPAVQRRLYRERHLPKGRLSGETVNLLNIIRDMHLDQRISLQIQPLLEAYDISLDRALRQREEPMAGRSNMMLQALEEQDREKQYQALRQHVDRQIVVRNVNDEYIEQIAMVLPADLGEQFRATALDRAYPRVYRETPIQRLFKSAVELEGLDPSTLQAVVSLETEFLDRLRVINRQLLEATRDYEPKEALERAGEFVRRMDGQQAQPKQNPTNAMFAEREEVSRQYVKRLHGLLTEEQFASLPGGYRWIEAPLLDQEGNPPTRQTSKETKQGKSQRQGIDRLQD